MYYTIYLKKCLVILGTLCGAKTYIHLIVFPVDVPVVIIFAKCRLVFFSGC